MPETPLDQLLLIEEAAEELRLSPNTLRWMRKEGKGPRSMKIGRRIMYRRSAIDEYILAQDKAEQERWAKLNRTRSV